MRRRRIVIIAVVIAGVVAASRLAGDTLAPTLLEVSERLLDGGVTARLLFVVIYAVATVLLIPGSVLTLAAGAALGPVQGLIWALCGAVAGGAAAFLLSRTFLRKHLVRRLSSYRWFEPLEKAVERESVKIILLARLSPLVPFVLLNYALGAMHVRFWTFVVVSAVGMVPGGFAYAYAGSVAGRALLTGERAPQAGWWLSAVGAAASVLLVAVMSRIAKRSLIAEMEKESVRGGARAIS